HGNQGKHRVTKRGHALSYPMFTLVTSEDIAGSVSHTPIQRCQQESSDEIKFWTLFSDQRSPSRALIHGNQGKHRVTKRGPALSYPMFTLVTSEDIAGSWYDPLFSVLGNEEHLEPFLSLLLVISQSTFDLNLQVCATYQIVPCRELGMVLRYLEGRVFVVEVLPDSQTEVDEVVLAGDIIDEINGVSLRNAYNGQAGTVLSKLKGEPLIFGIIRWRWKDGEVFRPLKPYLKGVKERVPDFQLQQNPRNLERRQDRPQQDGRLLYSAQYLGQTDVGMFGGKEILDTGITRVQKQKCLPRVSVMLLL
ncbi:unnamed protein product, partial [Ranitomeya imitator]